MFSKRTYPLSGRIADGDSAEFAAELITQACCEGNVDPTDNGNLCALVPMIATLGGNENYGNLGNRRIVANQLLCSGPFESGHHHLEHQQIR